MKQNHITTKQLTALICGAFMTACGTAHAGSIISQPDAPAVGAYDIAQLNGPASDTENIGGAGVVSSGENDAFTYVANDRNTQGQLFTTGTLDGGFNLSGIWVQHVGYTEYLDNGTWSGLNDGTSITLRIVDPSQADTAGFVMHSQVSTVDTGSGIGGGGDWNGTGNWLYMSLDAPVTLAENTQYGFDLTSYGPWFELAGLDTEQYGGGSAYTTGAKEDLNMGTVHDGDRAFVVELTAVPEPGTLALAGLGLASLLILRRNRRA